MKQRGFTLVELISMLVILGILAAVAMPYFFQTQTFDARAFSDQAQSMMRYAQKLAIAQNREVFVRLNGNSFAFCFAPFASGGSCADQVPAISNNNSGTAATLAQCSNSSTWLCEAIPSEMTYAATPASNGFYFDALGKPYNVGDAIPNSTFATLKISLTGGGMTRNLIVERETGYVHPE
ncbi:MAG TPA: type II secretion system protein [Noviherbaspirillum sp.]|jgi:MSHA pilin protein MshC|uniref:pilus assembly FimT family protein n=1 Tax=Noviherbaspirillum sp. TaxID=1926288 RepID=UPI002DDD7E89|nr:type II secretion system protein [Noviherbaspirillum sp.]HEV2610304.1 type II secretion system protein [Noviherbaspirillum sp.]